MTATTPEAQSKRAEVSEILCEVVYKRLKVNLCTMNAAGISVSVRFPFIVRLHVARFACIDKP